MAYNPMADCSDGFIPLNEPNVESVPRLRNINNIADDNRFKRLKRESINVDVKEEYIPAPWMRCSTYSPSVVGLHEEINDFYQTMFPTNQEIDVRQKVIQHVKHIVHSLWPQAKVEVFGSSRTGLFLPTSDIDIVVTGKWDHLPLQTLRSALLSNGIKDDDISVLSNATVPLVRLVHSLTKLKVDISFNVRNGVKSAKMIKEFVRKYPMLPKLLFILKQFLIHRRLNEVFHGGMSSYTLTILIISFLQGHHRPAYLTVRNLGALLIEFFELYGVNFNYEKVSLDILHGGSYRPKRNPWESYLSIIDPLCEGNDIAKGTYLMYQIKNSFQNAYCTLSKAVTEMYDQNRNSSILQLILDVDPTVLEYRQWISDNYSDIMEKFPCFESDTASLDISDIVGESSPSKVSAYKMLDAECSKNKSWMSNNSPMGLWLSEVENFENVYSPSKYVACSKQEWRTGQNRSRSHRRHRRNSSHKNCDR